MRNIGMIARREFLAAVMNKGFLIGLLLLPALGLGLTTLVQFVARMPPPGLRGEIAVIDRTGLVAEELRASLDPRPIAARRGESSLRAFGDALERADALPTGSSRLVEQLVGPSIALRVLERRADADVRRETAWLLDESPAAPRLALVVVHPDAVTPPSDGRGGAYDVYVRTPLTLRMEQTLREALRHAIVNVRLRAHHLDRGAVERLMRVTTGRSHTVTPSGSRPVNSRLDAVVPLVFGVLLAIMIFAGGQGLLTSTVEEKSSRVVEVLLSAVSPFELMAGKVLGHLAVTIFFLAVQIGIGMAVLVSLALIGLLDPWLLFYFTIFLLVSYVMFGALMAALGAAVNDLHEAQALTWPITLLMIVPMILTPLLATDPRSTWSLVLSFVPPVNTFVMMIRLASSVPPPAWQIWLTIAISSAAVAATTWFAAKIFRVGLLMHGKPPNLATLIRWARAA